MQHRTLLPSSVTSTIRCCFCFGSVPSLFLELVLHWSAAACWAPTYLGSSSFSVLSFCLFILFITLIRHAKNCNTCSQYWSTERVQFSTTTAEHMLDNQCSRSWTNWAMKFCPITVFPWPLANWLPLLQASWQRFAGKTLPQPAGGRKCFLRVCWILKHGFLHYRNKHTSFFF